MKTITFTMSSGLMEKIKNIQTNTKQKLAKGKAISTQLKKVILYPADSNAPIATAFCGEEIGVNIPPKLHENASPTKRAFFSIITKLEIKKICN